MNETDMGRAAEGRDNNVMLRVMDVPDGAAREMISERLERFNDEASGIPDDQPLDVLVTNVLTGEVIGGLVGRTSLGVFFINLFFLPEDMRRQGVGRRILESAEAEARRRGCRRAVLFTISFQAPDFYERHGYHVFGRIDCEPPGHARLFMTKMLHESAKGPM